MFFLTLWIENTRVALVGLRSNKLRSALTMLGITIGVAAVIVLVSIGQAVDSFVRDQFSGLGTNLIGVFPGTVLPGTPGQSTGNTGGVLTLADVTALQNPLNVPDALAVLPQMNLTRTTTFGNSQMLGRVRGVYENFPSVRSRAVVVGRFFDRAEVDGLSRVVVIGYDVVERLFGTTYPIGQEIRIDNVPFQVIGVMAQVPVSGFGGNDNEFFFVPVTTAQTRLSGERNLTGQRPITSITVQAQDAESVDLVALQVRETLRAQHGINFRDEDDFQIFTQSDLLDSLSQITGLMTIFLAIIAGISLLVGGIGIMNIMMVTVTERTREIGLRKAVGAQKRDIIMQFLIEAAVISLIGGAIGITISSVGALIVSSLVEDLNVNVQLSSILVASLISLGIGLFFGIYPANRAASLNPIDALRYE